MWMVRFVCGIVLMLSLSVSAAQARPAYAMKEGQDCSYCHIKPASGCNFRGFYYREHNHSFADFDNLYEARAAGVAPDAMGPEAEATVPDYPNIKVPPALHFSIKDIDGKTINLARYQGNVVLIVNVASLSANTPQYASLQELHKKYSSKGLVILGFPSNDFNHQEPADNKVIKEFCTSKYNITFPIFSRLVVKGEGQAPLYRYLTSKTTGSSLPNHSGDIEADFTKFLLGRNGQIVTRFKPSDDPLKATDMIAAIEKELALK